MWKIRLFSVLSVPAFGILYLMTVLIILLLLPILSMNMKKTAHSIIRVWAVSVFYVIGKRVHIEGYENIARHGKYILVANHASLFDIVAIISFFPDLSWFGHERLTRIPVFNHLLKMMNYIPMKRSGFRDTKEMINQLIEKSEAHTIGIFPEGTRSLDGKINDFYRGFIILLKNADIDVLPVTLKGFFDLKPKNRFYIGFDSRLDIVIHKPILRADLLLLDDAMIISKVKGKIESVV